MDHLITSRSSKTKRGKFTQDRITFTGWLEGDKKNAMLGGASLLVLPSHQENFGLCVMEALSHSVPVLVSPNVNLAAEIERRMRVGLRR